MFYEFTLLLLDGDWKVFVTTDESNDGGDVTMVVYGDKGNSGPIVLGKATDSGLFSAGNLDEFKVKHLTVTCLYVENCVLICRYITAGVPEAHM